MAWNFTAKSYKRFLNLSYLFSGVPWCFNDPLVSQGGDFCPADLGYSEGELVDCFPEPDVDRASCLAKGCYWCPGEVDSAPWCYVPKEYGYRMVGEPTETPMGRL